VRRKRVIRVVLWGVKGVLLAVCLGALTLWLLSSIGDGLTFTRASVPDGEVAPFRGIRAECAAGRVLIEWYTGEIDSRHDPRQAEMWRAHLRLNQGWRRAESFSPPFWWLFEDERSRFGGFARYATVTRSRALRLTSRDVNAPLWAVALITGFWPVSSMWLAVRRRLRTDRRLVAGQCPVCGYDLRATPERCPECSTVPAAETPA
jgi:hypothetical protein